MTESEYEQTPWFLQKHAAHGLSCSCTSLAATVALAALCMASSCVVMFLGSLEKRQFQIPKDSLTDISSHYPYPSPSLLVLEPVPLSHLTERFPLQFMICPEVFCPTFFQHIPHAPYVLQLNLNWLISLGSDPTQEND